MTETEPESLGKMEKTVSKTVACDPTLEAKTELCLSKEETLGCDFSDFKTPLHPTSGHKSRLAWAQNSCDSGFNSVQSGAFSDRSSSVGSSVRSSPEPSTSLSGRRVTLGTCEFSPVTRESFPIIRSRKLDFHSKDLFTDSSNLHFVDEELKNQESYSEDSETQEKRECVDDGFVEELNNSLSPVSPGLFCFQNDTVPRQRQRINDIDLEVSLQDMSLEESTSSSSSLSSRSGSGSNSPFHHTEIKKDICQKKEEPVPSISCSSSETNEVPTHILNWIACVSKTPNCNEQNIPSLSSCKTNFMTTLHLTEAHDTSTDSAHSVLSSPSYPPLNQTSSKSVIKPPSHTCFQPQFFPSESSLIKSLSEVCPSSLQAGAHPCKSPCKRTGGNELDVDHILSPTKSRKMESCQEQSSISCATRKIFHGDLPANYASGPNTDRLQSMLLSSLDHPKRTGITFGHKPSLGRCPGKVHQETNRYAEPGTPACNLSKRLQKVLQMSLPSEPSRLIGRNIGVVKFDIIEALHKNFNLCVAKILSFLPPADLIRVRLVSKAWGQALESDTPSFNRYKHHILDFKAKKRTMLAHLGKENAVEKVIDKPRPKAMTESRGCFSSLQVQASPQAVQPLPPNVPPKSDAHSGVQWGDELRRCPSCQHSALVRPHQGRAVCRNSTCGFDFCTQCFAAYHHPKPCKPLGWKCSVTKKDVAGSLKSKKSLKRL